MKLIIGAFVMLLFLTSCGTSRVLMKNCEHKMTVAGVEVWECEE